MSMLGLRRNPLSRRKRDSTPSSLTSTRSTEDVPSATPSPMPSPMPLSPAVSGVRSTSEAIRSSDAVEKRSVSVTMKDVRNETLLVDDNADVDTTNDNKAVTRTSGNVSSSFEVSKTAKTFEVAVKTKKRIVRELHDVTYSDFERVDLQFYLTYIADERLIHMPARGSDWDRVLTAAEYFGMQLDEFASRVPEYVRDSYFVRDTALASCYLLLQLGCEQAEALEPTFNALYALGILLARTVRLKDHFSPAITQDVGDLFSGLVELVGDIAVCYRRQIRRIADAGGYIDAVNIDFDAHYGDALTDIWAKREHLVNHLWKQELGDRLKNLPLGITALRQKLGATRDSVKAQVYGRVAQRKEKVEGTCEWIQRDLSDFVTGKEQIFTVTGNGGCGKSFLAFWVRERLEKHVNLRKFDTISFTFAEDNPANSTPVAFLKDILSQLLEQSVGDIQLFEKLSKLFGDENDNGHDAAELETQLWGALDVALATRAHNKSRYPRLILVVDGLDEVVGGHNAVRELHGKIFRMVDKHIRIRAITFSRPVSHVGVPGGRHLVVTPEHIRDDIELYLESRLSLVPAFKKESHQEQSSVLSTLVSLAKGSFLFAYLAVEYLKLGLELYEFHKSIQGIKGDSTTEILDKIFHRLDLKDDVLRSVFAFVLAAERRLTIGELGDLLRANVHRKIVSESVNVRKAVQNTRGLVVIQKGLVRFKNSAIRSHLLKHVCGTALMSLKDSHTMLVMSLLLLAKRIFSNKQDPSFEQTDMGDVRSTFASHHIADYFIQYWVTHFKSSSLISKSGDLALTADFKEVFPDTSFVALIEWSSWQSLFGLAHAMALHDLTLRIRTACFGEKHRTVLQNFVALASLYRTQSDTVKAAEYYYKASSVGQTVLYKFSPFVVSCANIFLVLSETIRFSKRTTMVTYREETIRFVITVCKHQYGAHSDAVIQWLEVLAKLYKTIGETHHAAVIYKELREIIIIRFGPNSAQARDIVKETVELSVVLRKDGGGKDIDGMDESLFDLAEDVDHGSDLWFEVTIRRIEYYLKVGQLAIVESLYLTLWHRIGVACHQRGTAELYLLKLEVALKYVRFLREHKRHEEACNIVICVWTEYEHRGSDSETFILHLKELALIARSFGLVTVTLAVLNRVWAWFKEHKLLEHEESISTTVLITEVVEESTQTIVESTTRTTGTETLTREVWELHYTRCKTGKDADKFIRSCVVLVNMYLRLGKWSEAETVIRKSLEVTWEVILTTSTQITIEGVFIKERIQLAVGLARCHHRQGHYDEAEQLYLRIFQACLASLKADDAHLFDIAITVAVFYDEHHRHEKAIDVYVQLVNHYRKQLGAKHSQVVSVLYKLAAAYMTLGRKEAYDCYIEIASHYINDGYCRGEGIDAAVIVLNFYHHEHRWAELQRLCEVLWRSFTHHHHEHTFSAEVVQVIYERYRYVLEYHAKVEFKVLYRITVEYRETATKVFGVTSLILVAALTALAELCEGHEEHRDEAITIYEEIITRNKTVTTETDTRITTIKQRLSKLYVTVITSSKSTTTTTIERAVVLCSEVYEKLRVELGWWHETTLIQLRELVLLYRKRGTKESTITVTKLLQSTFIEIITRVTDSWTLYTTAGTLASIFTASDMVQSGHDLLRQLHVLLLFPKLDIIAAGGETETTIKVNSQATRASFIFIIVFEHVLAHSQADLDFSQLMASVLLETLLYEQYLAVMASFSEATRTEILLERAARLRSVWVARDRTSLVAALDRKLLPIFKARYARHLGGAAENAQAVVDLYEALIFEIGTATSADQTKIDYAVVTCKAATAVVRRFMVDEEKPDLVRANAVAKGAFQFANTQKFYHERRCIAHGYRLAELLAGVNVPAWKAADDSVKSALLSSSRQILQGVLSALRDAKIEPVSLRFDDLMALIKLLGEQKNYGELELFLTSLWQSREVQRNWSPDVVLRIGTLLVHAHFLASHPERAIALCNTIYYNLRRSHGGLDPQALEFADLLATLFKLAGRRRDAIRVHEDVVSDLDEHMVTLRSDNLTKLKSHNGTNGKGSAPETNEHDDRLRAAADAHLEGLRRCGWATRGDGRAAMSELHKRLQRYGPLSVRPIEQWGPVNDDEVKDRERQYVGPNKWVLIGAELDKDTKGKKPRDSITPAKERWGCWEVPRQVQVKE